MRKKLILFILSFILSLAAINVALVAAENNTLNFVAPEEVPISLYRIIHYALKEIGFDLKVSIQGTTSSIISVSNGESDGLIANIAGLEEKYPNIYKIPESFSQIHIEVFTRKDNPKIKKEITNWIELSKLTVGHVYQKPFIEANLPENIKKSKQYKNSSDLLNAVESGEIDVAIHPSFDENSPILKSTIKKVGCIADLPVYTYINKEYAYLADRLNATIKNMKESGMLEKISKDGNYPNAKKNKVILYLSSYTSDKRWEELLKDGFRNQYEKDGASFEVQEVNLNFLRHIDDNAHYITTSNLIKNEFYTNSPDVIVVSDDEALNYLKQIYHLCFYGTPVVFCGINNYDEHVIDGFEDYFTGITEHISAKETVELMLKLFPDTNKIYIINDYSLTGLKWKADIRNQLASFSSKNKITIEHSENQPLDQLLAKIQSFEKGTLILTGFYSLDGLNQYYPERNSQKLFDEYSKVPIFGLSSTSFGYENTVYGHLGGKYVDPINQGELAQKIADSILSGESVSNIPVITDTIYLNNWKFDYNALKKWHIKKADLPENSIIINKKQNLIESNPYMFFSVLIFIFLLLSIISGLSFFTKKLRKSNLELIETQKKSLYC